jgi:hypothetical protein
VSVEDEISNVSIEDKHIRSFDISLREKTLIKNEEK